MADITGIITTHTPCPKWLIRTLLDIQEMDTRGLNVQWLCVSDHRCNTHAQGWCEYFGVDYIENTGPHGMWGAWCHDLGVEKAHGEYLCFLDHDNAYSSHYLTTLWDIVHKDKKPVDIAVACTMYRCRTSPQPKRIPSRWTGTFMLGDVDTMCVMVRRTVAKTEKWSRPNDVHDIANDFDWLKRLEKGGASIRHTNQIIGWHL